MKKPYGDADQISKGSMLQAEVCVIGAGAAGITMATQLARKGVAVLLLEGGSQEISGDSQSLYQADQSGIPYFDMTACRLRFLGGTTNHWGGYCRENDPIDYEARPSLNIQGWPVSYQTIRPYVERAAHILGIEAQNFDPHAAFAAHPDLAKGLLDGASDRLETKVFLMAKNKRFKADFGEELQSSDKITVLLGANVVGLDVDGTGNTVATARIKTTKGNEFTVKAKTFVLAAHAVENARLLLVSNSVHKAGLGNLHGHVGRYFMEHPEVVSGLFYPNANFPKVYNYETMYRIGVNANLSLTREVMLEKGILQYYCRFDPLYGFEDTEKALKKAADGFKHPLDQRLLKALTRVTQRPIESMQVLGSRAGIYRPEPKVYSLQHRIEQAPNPDSRITLSDEVDALGVRKVVLNWDFNELDYRTFSVGQQVVASEIERLKLGRFESPALTPDVIRRSAEGHYHHIGTTRMGQTENDSVVDANCRVHGTSNLYVTGSGIFPTAGYSGPTMMIIAFALRLAEHLTSRKEQ